MQCIRVLYPIKFQILLNDQKHLTVNTNTIDFEFLLLNNFHSNNNNHLLIENKSFSMYPIPTKEQLNNIVIL